MKEISQELVDQTKTWLSEAGIKQFKTYKQKYGTVSPVIPGPIPHAVHFREGMQVRNFMRQTKLCENWNAHDYDNTWETLIERCIE